MSEGERRMEEASSLTARKRLTLSCPPTLRISGVATPRPPPNPPPSHVLSGSRPRKLQ